jgi:zona occludens toxin
MPINAFGGGPGSGKTYGVMEHVILPAVAKGRFVITNIDGLNVEAIYEYVAKEFYKGKILCIGHIRHCDRGQPDLVTFFPGEDALDKAMPVPEADSQVVCGGDLVVIDEATRYWSTGEKVKKEHAYFFREHRHFANECGHTCDLVVIDPDLTMLARALRGKIELSSVTHKPKELGLERYVVKLYSRSRITGKPVSVSGPYPFRKEIYSLYRSYAVEGAKEQAVDGRQSLRGKIIFKFVAMLVLLICGLIAFGLAVRHKMQTIHDQDKGKAVLGAGGAAKASTPGAPVDGPVAAPGASAGRSQLSPLLRVVGEVTLRGERWVVVSDGVAVRLESPGAFVGRGVMVVGTVEGERVSSWSGPRAAAAGGK